MANIIPQQEHNLLDNWVADFNNGDLDAVCAHYSPKAVLIPSVAKGVKQNIDSIRRHFADIFTEREKVRTSLLSCNVLYENGHRTYRGRYGFTWYEGTKLCHANAQYSFVIDGNKIIVHHSSLVRMG